MNKPGALLKKGVWLFLFCACTAESIFLDAPILRAGTVTVQYSYDNRGRLLKADYGAEGSVTYKYDRAGNLLTTVATPASSQTEPGAENTAAAGTPEETEPDTP